MKSTAYILMFNRKLQFEGGVVGKALKGPICTFEFSGGVNMDHSSVVGLVATTIAHEMGHNLGMEHDTENSCICPEGKCIMSPSSRYAFQFLRRTIDLYSFQPISQLLFLNHCFDARNGYSL